MDQNDFYEDDEPIEEVGAAWKRGEEGVTSGPRDLDQRARSIVDRAVERWEAVTTIEVDTTGWFASPDAGAREQESTSLTTTDRLSPARA